MKTPPLASILLRILFLLVLLPVLAFCIFGLLATFEPLPQQTQWIWRSIYGILGAGCIFGIIRLLIPEQRKR